MSEEASVTRSGLSWVKVVLVVFPAGLIVLGIGSMVWYFNKKKDVEQRSIRYAAGLMKPVNADDLARYERLISETKDERVLAGFLESTLGPENMGYSLRMATGRGNNSDQKVACEVELTGLRRPREVVLVVVSYLPAVEGGLTGISTARSTAIALSVAHALTGERQNRSLRFVFVQNLTALGRYYETMLDPDDRVTNVVTFGQMALLPDETLLKTLHLSGTGALVERPEFPADAEIAARKLCEVCKSLAGRL